MILKEIKSLEICWNLGGFFLSHLSSLNLGYILQLMWEKTTSMVHLIINGTICIVWIFPGGSDGKVSTYNAGDLGSIPGLGRSPREENGNPLQYSWLENPVDGGTWLGYSAWGRKESDTTEQLHFTMYNIMVFGSMFVLM